MKKTKKNPHSTNKLLILSIGLITLLAGVFIYLSRISSSLQVAQVNTNVSCKSNLRSVTMEEECAPASFKKATAICQPTGDLTELTFNVVEPDKCLDYASIYGESKRLCGTTCVLSSPSPAQSPYPSPSPKPSLTPTPTPSPRACMFEQGTCLSKTKTCLTYSDSCAKADFCAKPIQSCLVVPSPSPVPSGCYYQAVQCIQAPCNPVLVCPALGSAAPIAPQSRKEFRRCLKLFGRSLCLPYPRNID